MNSKNQPKEKANFSEKKICSQEEMSISVNEES